jgi:hypothetical protein
MVGFLTKVHLHAAQVGMDTDPMGAEPVWPTHAHPTSPAHYGWGTTHSRQARALAAAVAPTAYSGL